MASAEERGFLKAIKENPDDQASRLAYADWLEDHDRPHDALNQRVKAGVSQLGYKIRRKSDGLFSDGNEGGMWEVKWSTQGRQWSNLGHVRGHFTRHSPNPFYGSNTRWDDLEVVLFEVRIQPISVLPVSREEQARGWSHKVVIYEPKESSGEQ